MASYFYVFDAALFHGTIRPALAESWRARSFVPCRSLCAVSIERARAIPDRLAPGHDTSFFERVVEGLPFDRHFWTLLVGELLLATAADFPEIQTDPELLRSLLALPPESERSNDRQTLSPLDQVHQGTHDLAFGGKLYRPDQVGWNDPADVARLAAFLNSHSLPDPDPGSVTKPADEESVEEWAFAQSILQSLRDLYDRAGQNEQMIICEARLG